MAASVPGDDVPRDPYAFLGIEPGASAEEIKKAFRRSARSIHPDKNLDDPHAEAKFHQLQAVVELLLDPERRRRYDETQRQATALRRQFERHSEQRRKFAEDLHRREKQQTDDLRGPSSSRAHAYSSQAESNREFLRRMASQEKKRQRPSEPAVREQTPEQVPQQSREQSRWVEVTWDPAISLKVSGVTRAFLEDNFSAWGGGTLLIFQPRTGVAVVELATAERAKALVVAMLMRKPPDPRRVLKYRLLLQPPARPEPLLREPGPNDSLEDVLRYIAAVVARLREVGDEDDHDGGKNNHDDDNDAAAR